MPLTSEQLEDFIHFAREKLSDGGAESIVELAVAWEESRELAKSIDRLRQSDADIEVGRIKPLDEAVANVHKNLRKVR